MKFSEWVVIAQNNGQSVLSKIILRVLLRKLPFLATGPLNYLTIKAVSWLAKETAEEAEMRAFFGAMDLSASAEGRELKAIMIRNTTIQKIGSEDDKKQIEAELEESLNKFVNLYR